MRPGVAPRVKVCCMANVDEARLAIAHGASALGLVSAMPSGPGPIDESKLAAFFTALEPSVNEMFV
jgi:phosphoribosylanthranilate isomerase